MKRRRLLGSALPQSGFFLCCTVVHCASVGSAPVSQNLGDLAAFPATRHLQLSCSRQPNNIMPGQAAAGVLVAFLGLISVSLMHIDTVARPDPALNRMGHLRYQDLSSTEYDSSKDCCECSSISPAFVWIFLLPFIS